MTPLASLAASSDLSGAYASFRISVFSEMRLRSDFGGPITAAADELETVWEKGYGRNRMLIEEFMHKNVAFVVTMQLPDAEHVVVLGVLGANLP